MAPVRCRLGQFRNARATDSDGTAVPSLCGECSGEARVTELTSSQTMTWRARAKLNLYLHIVGRRADGYHLLESLVAFCDAGDSVRVESTTGLSLSVEGPFASALSASPPHENLVLRAAAGLADWARRNEAREVGARLILEKNLPVASGIGGGSADAAAALLALRAMWRLGIGDADLMSLGSKLGADVPACLSGTPAVMSGVGDVLTPVPAFPETAVLLVNPGIPLATPQVYRAFAQAHPLLADRQGLAPTGPWPSADRMVADLRQTRNDLEPVAISLCSAIAQVLEALRAAPGCRLARMSGSGASCFGIFETSDLAASAAALLRTAQPSWWTAACRLVSEGGAAPR